MQVKVWNENDYDYKEKFRDEVVRIPAKEFIWMEEDQAALFAGTMPSPPFVLDADGQHMAKGFKKIRIEKVAKGVELSEEKAKKDLAAYLEKENEGQTPIKDAVAEEFLKTRKTKGK